MHVFLNLDKIEYVVMQICSIDKIVPFSRNIRRLLGYWEAFDFDVKTYASLFHSNPFS